MHASTSPRKSGSGRHSRYLISPSLPGGVQRLVAQCQCSNVMGGADKMSTTLPQLQSTFLSATLTRESSLKGKNSSFYSTNGVATLDDPLFSETLAGIGPSARKLLELDEKKRSAEHRVSFLAGKGRPTSSTTGIRKKANSSAAEKNSSEERKKKYVSPSSVALSEDKDRQSSFDDRTFLTRMSGTFTRTAKKELEKEGLENRSFKATIIRKPNEEPVTVVNLRKYLNRELRLACGEGFCVPQTAEALGPYREVFRAITSAFPGYSQLLCDIQSAYDNVLQAQSELLEYAYSKDRKNHELAQKYEDDTTQLRSTIAKLEADLERVELEMKERDQKANQLEHQRLQAGALGARSDNIALQKQLDISTRRVGELEEIMKGDSEKILVLIGAVRECDKRLKAYEAKVSFMSGQVAELNEFQRLAGEAQAELQNYKHKFRAYVSAEDFEMMRNHLSQELVIAQQLARRLRRTAAVRSTQVDVMMRKVRQLEADQKKFISAESNMSSNSSLKSKTDSDYLRTEVLTPRPQWEEIYSTVPELQEYVKPIHNESIPSIMSRTLRKEENQATVPPHDQNDGELVVVDGPKQTSLQVEFLAQTIKALKEELEVEQIEKKVAVTLYRQAHGLVSSARSNVTVADGSGGSQVLSARAAPGSKGSGPSTIGRHRSLNDMMKTLGSFPNSTLIICPGTNSSVPECIRCTGVAERAPVPFITATRLVYDFFHQDLLPMLELRELSASTEFEFSRSFLHFVQKKMDDEEGLQGYDSAPYVILNLIEDSKDPSLRTPALVLLVNIIHKIMPVRVAFDAILVVNHVVEDMNALAKEQQKSRLRRQAITECLMPVLELKTLEEMNELRASLGTDVSFELSSLISVENRFFRTFFFQQCQSCMDMYTKLLQSLSIRSTDMIEETYDKLITLEDLKEAIYEAEPKTPEVVIRELTENSTRRTDDSGGPVEEKLRLTDVVAVLDVSPIFLRTPQLTREQCVL